jgi:hypothetical protein
VRGALASLLLTLGGCSAAEVLDTTHSATVIVAPAAIVYLINPAAGVVALAATAAAELMVPDGTEEHIREARRDVVAKLEDADSTEPLPARLQKLKDELEAGESAFLTFREWLGDVLFWAAVVIGASVIFQLWHFWTGSRKSRALVGSGGEERDTP